MVKVLRLFFGVLVVAILCGCATPAKQTENFYHKSHHIKARQLIENVPFVNQDSGQCGPATLTMAMNWAGKPVTVQQIIPQVYNPKMNGSLQADLISSSRRNGLMAVPIEGIQSLIYEINAGHPVIVFENLAFSWLPQWHYAIVFGYDLDQRKVIMHSGSQPFKYWDMDVFERSWMLGDYWGLVVLPPGELALRADEVAHVNAASGLEQTGQLSAAEISYRSILKRWPKSLGALIGLGNIYYAQQKYQSAVEYLSLATRYFPNSAYAWHNLAVAQGSANLKSEAHLSASKAMKLASTENKKQFTENLSEWISQ